VQLAFDIICCSCTQNPVHPADDPGISPIIPVLQSKGVALQVFCVANIGTEMYPYILHMSQHYNHLAPLGLYFHGHGATGRCSMRTFFNQSRYQQYVGMGPAMKPQEGQTGEAAH
jgi:hypothetical protein